MCIALYKGCTMMLLAAQGAWQGRAQQLLDPPVRACTLPAGNGLHTLQHMPSFPRARDVSMSGTPPAIGMGGAASLAGALAGSVHAGGMLGGPPPALPICLICLEMLTPEASVTCLALKEWLRQPLAWPFPHMHGTLPWGPDAWHHLFSVSDTCCHVSFPCVLCHVAGL